MNSNMPIVILACENGFVVREYKGDTTTGSTTAVSECCVFHAVVELQAFVAEHFPHRLTEEIPDSGTPTEDEWVTTE